VVVLLDHDRLSSLPHLDRYDLLGAAPTVRRPVPEAVRALERKATSGSSLPGKGLLLLLENSV
jgi:hypothetical protein